MRPLPARGEGGVEKPGVAFGPGAHDHDVAWFQGRIRREGAGQFVPEYLHLPGLAVGVVDGHVGCGGRLVSEVCDIGGHLLRPLGAGGADGLQDGETGALRQGLHGAELGCREVVHSQDEGGGGIRARRVPDGGEGGERIELEG